MQITDKATNLPVILTPHRYVGYQVPTSGATYTGNRYTPV